MRDNIVSGYWVTQLPGCPCLHIYQFWTAIKREMILVHALLTLPTLSYYFLHSITCRKAMKEVNALTLLKLVYGSQTETVVYPLPRLTFCCSLECMSLGCVNPYLPSNEILSFLTLCFLYRCIRQLTPN